MSRNIIYRPLFQTNFWHAYYLHPPKIEESEMIDPINRPNALSIDKQAEIIGDQQVLDNYLISQDLAIYPTSATQYIMEVKKMRLRTENTGFSIWTQAIKTEGNNYEPFSTFDHAFKLSFYLQAKNASFYHFSNINLNSSSIYYFSNRTNHAVSNTLFLNQDSSVFETPQNYISDEDRFASHEYKKIIDVSALELKIIRLVLRSELYETEFIFEEPSDGKYLQKCQIHLNKLPTGLYDLTAYSNGAEISDLRQIFWSTSQVLPQRTVAVIELFFLSDASLGVYDFLNAQGELQNPVYTLWWQNRSTYWRYIFEKPQAEPFDDDEVHVMYETSNEPDPKRLISKIPQPLISRYRDLVYLTNADSEKVLLPNPSPQWIYPEGSMIYSEVYMGNIDLSKIV